MPSFPLFSIFFFSYLLVVAVNGNASGGHRDREGEDEHKFTYFWNKANGPKNWGKLNPEWKACSIGKFQSPINLASNSIITVPALGELKQTYKPRPSSIKNRGHDIMVQWHGDAGGIVINGTEYKLVQCHWHFPAEHTINGKRYKMEMHMVHQSFENKTAAVGILYKMGLPDYFLSQLLHHIKNNVTEEPRDVGILNPWDIKFGSSNYYRYIGSLTVPPCTEGVIWTIPHKIKTVSLEQIRVLRDAVHDDFMDNSRPLQDDCGRIAFQYRSLAFD